MSHNNLNVVPFNKIKEFLNNGTIKRAPSATDLHILLGWQVSTIRSYNSAVIKYLKFAKASGRNDFLLPVTPEDVEDFCLWAGRSLFSRDEYKISACSIRKYLAGLKAWHVFHNETFPTVNKTRIDLRQKKTSWSEGAL
jgi:site-specific recombinase XerD